MSISMVEPDRTTQRAEYEQFWKDKLANSGLTPFDMSKLTIDGTETPSEGDVAKITYQFGVQVVQATMQSLQDVFNEISA